MRGELWAVVDLEDPWESTLECQALEHCHHPPPGERAVDLNGPEYRALTTHVIDYR